MILWVWDAVMNESIDVHDGYPYVSATIALPCEIPMSLHPHWLIAVLYLELMEVKNECVIPQWRV